MRHSRVDLCVSRGFPGTGSPFAGRGVVRPWVGWKEATIIAEDEAWHRDARFTAPRAQFGPPQARPKGEA